MSIGGFVGVEEAGAGGGEGVSAEDLVYMAPQEVERRLAVAVAGGGEALV